MKLTTPTILAAMMAATMTSCADRAEQGASCTRTEALPAAYWEQSIWISAANAPVVTKITTEEEYCPAAEGASWFVSNLNNEKQVTRARWMTTGLGTYVLFINGQAIGDEYLKPGYTHFAKTRRSFTPRTCLLPKSPQAGGPTRSSPPVAPKECWARRRHSVPCSN